jgi:hypothetical protein
MLTTNSTVKSFLASQSLCKSGNYLVFMDLKVHYHFQKSKTLISTKKLKLKLKDALVTVYYFYNKTSEFLRPRCLMINVILILASAVSFVISANFIPKIFFSNCHFELFGENCMEIITTGRLFFF